MLESIQLPLLYSSIAATLALVWVAAPRLSFRLYVDRLHPGYRLLECALIMKLGRTDAQRFELVFYVTIKRCK